MKGGSLRLPHLCKGLKHSGKTVVHIEGRCIVHPGVDHAGIQFCADVIASAVQRCHLRPHGIAVIVDGGDPLHIAAVGHLIALDVEAVTHTAVGGDHLAAPQIADGGR